MYRCRQSSFIHAYISTSNIINNSTLRSMNMFRLWRRPSDFDVALAPVSMCVCSWMWMKEKQDVRHICCNNTASKNQICILWWLYTECWSPDHAAIQWLSFELKMIIVFFTIFYSSHPFNENEGNYLDKWCEQCSHIADTHTTGFCQGLSFIFFAIICWTHNALE